MFTICECDCLLVIRNGILEIGEVAETLEASLLADTKIRETSSDIRKPGRLPFLYWKWHSRDRGTQSESASSHGWAEGTDCVNRRPV